jgi:Fe-S cluster assembly iron-binding protein IscA
MGIAESAAKGEETLEQEGLKVFLEEQASAWLKDATIDFSDLRGFVISGVSAC